MDRNFDIFVYEYTDNYELINGEENSGTQTELIVISPSTVSRYVYIAVANAGSQTSEYKLYADYVSPINKFLLSATKAMIMSNFDAETDVARSRSI